MKILHGLLLRSKVVYGILPTFSSFQDRSLQRAASVNAARFTSYRSVLRFSGQDAVLFRASFFDVTLHALRIGQGARVCS